MITPEMPGVSPILSVSSASAAALPIGASMMTKSASRPGAILPAAGDRPSAQFYAHLYLGLYHEAQGQADEALRHIRAAADGRYARAGGYMHMVAEVHLGVLEGR